MTYSFKNIIIRKPSKSIQHAISSKNINPLFEKILEEHNIINDSTRPDFTRGIENGALLISQINEYSAIFLAHKFRRFDLDLQIGLSEELHPTKSYSNSMGLVNKHHLYQNKNLFLMLFPTLRSVRRFVIFRS